MLDVCNGARKCLVLPEREVDVVALLGTPRGRRDEHSSKFPLIKIPRLSTSRIKASLLKVLLTDSGRAPPPASEQRGNLHTNNQDTLPQLFSEVVNLTGFSEHKGLTILCGRRIVCSKVNCRKINRA